MQNTLKNMIFLLLISTSLYPAATPPRSCDGSNASASVAPAAEIKRAAASRESQGKEAYEQSAEPFDGELDTAQSRLRRTPPTDAELEQARERAQKQNAQGAILLELSQPYANKDPHVFAFDLFKRWYALCANKGLLEKISEVAIFDVGAICGEIRSLNKEARDRVPLIAWCCLGIAFQHRGIYQGMWLLEKEYMFTSEMHRNEPSTAWWSAYKIYQAAPYQRIETSDRIYQEAQQNAPLIQGAVSKWILRELAEIVERYARKERIMVADAPRSILDSRASDLALSNCMIGSLEGLCDCTKSSIDLRFNIVTRIGRDDLPRGATLQLLQLYGNPISSIAPYAFAGQTALIDLALQECQLTRIARPMFAGLINLKQLFLNGNPISRIEQGALSQLSSLTRLDVHNAALQTVPEDLQALVAQGKLVTLDLDGNPLEQNSHQNEIKKKLLELVAANAGQAQNPQ